MNISLSSRGGGRGDIFGNNISVKIFMRIYIYVYVTVIFVENYKDIIVRICCCKREGRTMKIEYLINNLRRLVFGNFYLIKISRVTRVFGYSIIWY